MCDCDCGHHDWEEDSAQGDVHYDLRDRKIHPLPKRKRFLDSTGSPSSASYPVLAGGLTGKINELESDSEDDDVGDVDERHTRSSSTRGQEPALDLRSSGDQEYGDGRAHYPPRKRNESPSTNHRTSFHPESPNSPPSTSPCTSHHRQHHHHHYPCSEHSTDDAEEPKEFGLFGEEGWKIAKSLSSASSFSTAGLFGGLGLAHVVSGAGTGTDDRHYVEEEEEDGDEDTYGVVDRSRPPVEPTFESTISATVLGSGASNKKKRKIPGLTATSVEPGVNVPVVPSPAPSTIPPPQSRTRQREEEPSPTREYSRYYKDDWLPTRAPVNPPTTAKAALAKLRIRPPHISICPSSFSTRRYRRKRFKHNFALLDPLKLPDQPDFVPPAMPKEGPPKLPPGSGLKGSKALKAAAKLAKEKEKEKERIRKLFEGVKVPNLFDPYGRCLLPRYVVRMTIRLATEKKKTELREQLKAKQEEPSPTTTEKNPTGYPTPPASSDEGEDERLYPWLFERALPKLDSFEFQFSAPTRVERRWTDLQEQKERVKAAKERAAKAREEEKERKREKEERERAEKAAVAAAPPTPAPTPQRKSHAPPSQQLPPPPPVSNSSQPPPPSSASRLPPPPSDLPPAPPPASALPSPPHTQSPLLPRKAPLKKGRKKRSAHANAHNVHHRDNYVPSRLPAAPAQNQQHQQHSSSSNEPSLGPTSWPASPEAIASAGPYASTLGGGHYCDPDEWLCLFCEYQLFYGEEPALYRAVRKRKGVLKVRQKAKDRAMKATQGRSNSSTAPLPPPNPESSRDVEQGSIQDEEGAGGDEV
ncbi:hypothetical protein JCM3765_002682 [Sporobolomyces pararoseus]